MVLSIFLIFLIYFIKKKKLKNSIFNEIFLFYALIFKPKTSLNIHLFHGIIFLIIFSLLHQAILKFIQMILLNMFDGFYHIEVFRSWIIVFSGFELEFLISPSQPHMSLIFLQQCLVFSCRFRHPLSILQIQIWFSVFLSLEVLKFLSIAYILLIYLLFY